MSFNLIRNSRVFFTTNQNAATKTVASSGFTSSNTWELQVLDGFGFSQNTTNETVTLNESGATPVRGQRSFNTQLDPVDFNMTTYMRPYKSSSTTKAEESVLWNALFSASSTMNASTSAWKDGTNNQYAEVTLDNSDKHQLTSFGLIIVMDTSAFVIDDCVLNTATIDFGIDAIASVQWAGQAKAIRNITAPTFAGTAFSGSLTGDFTAKVTSAPFIANKLSVCTVEKTISDNSLGAISITVPGTGYTTAQLLDVDPPFTSAAYAGSTAVTLGNYVSVTNAGVTNYYKVVTAGTTAAATTPDHLSGIEANGTASLEWAGRRATAIVVSVAAGALSALAFTDAGAGYTGTTNIKLAGTSTVVATAALSGEYSVPLTGGNLTISNNVSYLTPAILGTVNQPATYFTGTRAISGSLTAYLRTGSANTSGLMEALLASKETDVAPAYNILIQVGGNATGSTHVDFEIPAGVLQIPTVATEQVVSTTINFTAAGSTGGSFDIAKANELNIKYYAA